MKRFALGFLGAGLILTPLVAHAGVTAKDIQVAGRVLNFTANPPTGSVKFGIVYDPAIASSAQDEQTLVGLMGSGLTVGGITLVPVPIALSALSSGTPDVFFLTAGLGAEGAQVGAAAASQKKLCITNDTAATTAGYCAVSVQTDPKVQITVNKAVAAASNSSFTSAFILMITEI